MKINELQVMLKDKLLQIFGNKDNAVNISVYENSSGVQFTLEEFFNHYNPEEIQKGQCNLVFKIDYLEQTIAGFQLKDMYNCCGIIVASDLHISKLYRNRGIGTLMTSFVYEFSKYYGYGMLQCADKIDNEYQKKIFEKLGWNMVSSFINTKTGNILGIWLLKLN